MIINFSNLGGGGGGGTSYVAGDYIQISGATISVTGVTPDDYAMASALTEDEQVWASALTDLHTDISAVTAEMASKQAKFTAATNTEMNALTGVSEGDICVVAEFREEVPEETFHTYLQSYTQNPMGALEYTLGYSPKAVVFRAVENPYYDSTLATQFGYFEGYISGDTYLQLGARLDGGVLSGGTTWGPTLEWSAMTAGDELVINNWNKAYIYGWSSTQNIFVSTANTTGDQLLYKAYVLHPQTTFQYNNGTWIELATASDVNSAMTRANQAYDVANNKLSNSGMWIQDWSSLTYTSNGVYQLNVNNVDEGYRLHVNGASTDYTNPKIDEIVTSDSFLRVMKMTQDEYDNLQTKDPLVCYIIVEEG